MDKEAAVREYLAKHRINDLFASLATSLAVYQPEDVKGFLIEELERRVKQGSEASILTVQEIESVFDLNDLMNKGVISKDKAVEGLKLMCTSHKQEKDVESMSISDQVSKAEFVSYALKTFAIHSAASTD